VELKKENAKKELTIIVVNYNCRLIVQNCIYSILQNVKNIQYEVIVVDNNSNDNSLILIEKNFKDCILIRNDKNNGFAKAVNQGFKIAKGEILLILNPDVKILPASIEKAIHFLEDNPNVAILLPKLLNPDGSLQYSCRTFYDLPTILLRRTFLKKIFPNHSKIKEHLMLNYDHEKPREVDWGLGACMFIRKNAIEDVNLMDERFFLYFEDVDLCWRMKEKGWKVIYFPKSVMIHAHLRHSAKGLFNRAKWEHFVSFLKFCIKHGRLKPQKRILI